MTNSLTTQIEDAEQQVLRHQREASICTAMLTRKIRQQMTDPATLALAGGIGFILGELTKRQPQKLRGALNSSPAAETSPLKIALNLITSVRTLYTALPLAWMVKSYYRPGMSGQTPEPQLRPATAYAATDRRRRLTDRLARN